MTSLISLHVIEFRSAEIGVKGFTVKKKLDFLDRSVINLLAEFGHSSQNVLGSMMEFP